jgi:hypothetical protein
MLTIVRLVGQWREILRGLPQGWSEARLLLTLDDAADGERAAAVLAPLNPMRRGKFLRFSAARRDSGASPDLVTRLLQRFDAEGLRGELQLVRAGEAPPAPEVSRPTLDGAWDELVATLPPDWSDVYAEIELVSTDHLDRAALLLAPVNPARDGDRPAFRFRVARRFGYGASPGMTRRCLERLDDDGIRGEVRILRVLSDTEPVATQGPVWYVGGHVV